MDFLVFRLVCVLSDSSKLRKENPAISEETKHTHTDTHTHTQRNKHYYRSTTQISYGYVLYFFFKLLSSSKSLITRCHKKIDPLCTYYSTNFEGGGRGEKKQGFDQPPADMTCESSICKQSWLGKYSIPYRSFHLAMEKCR